MAKVSDKREFVQLAHNFNAEKDDPTGWYMSEKMDGMRCIWDGGITIGMKAKDVPWANTDREGADHICTGLWTRGGKVVHCPPEFTADHPRNILLDGELWNRGLTLQSIISITRAHDKTEEWEKISHWIFDSPSPEAFLKAGRIHAGEWEVTLKDMTEWAYSRGLGKYKDQPFSSFVKNFHDDPYTSGPYACSDSCQILPQKLCKKPQDLLKYLDKIIAKGGEGVVIRNPESIWEPRRSHDCLKVKKFYDAEAIVQGLTFGKDTDKGGRLKGMMGTIIVKEEGTGHVFEIGSGFSDELRALSWSPALTHPGISVEQWASDKAGQSADDLVVAMHFPVGKKITFKYWDRSESGIPKFAVYFRDKIDE